MKIGIDARLYQESGIGRYIRNLLNHLQQIDQENEYALFLLKKDFDSLTFQENFHKVLADYRWYGFEEQLKFLQLLNKQNLDLVHFPHFNIPIFYRKRFVVTIHDLIHQKFAMKRATTLNPLVYKIKLQSYNLALKTALKKSQKVITVSDYVKKELVKDWKISDDKIVVTHEAVEEEILKTVERLTEKEIKAVLSKFGIKPPFLFYVGNAHPHKNVEGLIQAFLELRKSYQYLQLVLSGNDHYFWQRIKKEFQDKNIIYTGFISEEELVALYNSAQVFVMPSFEEGFGIPLLEAMACGCPVVSSSKASLKEVGGDAVEYFNPNNQPEMVEKIMQVLNNQNLRKKLIEKGKQRYQQFSWKLLANETLKVYEQTTSRDLK